MKEKARELLRKHQWRCLSSFHIKTVHSFEIEFWVSSKGKMLIMQFWDKGGSSCYFSDGNPTWDDWEKMLS